MKLNLTPINFAEFKQFCLQHEIASNASVKGTLNLGTKGFQLWQTMQHILKDMFKPLDVKEVLLSSLIAYVDLEKERSHLTGFDSELFCLQSSLAKELPSSNQRIVLRPTSEISFCHYFRETIQTRGGSYKALPIKVYQWVNVWRSEKNTKLFFRGLEFYWQEGHAVFASQSEAELFLQDVYKTYQAFFQSLGLDFLCGKKPPSERFPGAVETYTIEVLLPDGQALQCATVHNLGQNFTIPFKVSFDGQNNQKTFAWEISWGLSTRLLGAIVLQTYLTIKARQLPLTSSYLVNKTWPAILRDEMFPTWSKTLTTFQNQPLKNHNLFAELVFVDDVGEIASALQKEGMFKMYCAYTATIDELLTNQFKVRIRTIYYLADDPTLFPPTTKCSFDASKLASAIIVIARAY